MYSPDVSVADKSSGSDRRSFLRATSENGFMNEEDSTGALIRRLRVGTRRSSTIPRAHRRGSKGIVLMVPRGGEGDLGVYKRAEA